jgi:hypothetical protein
MAMRGNIKSGPENVCAGDGHSPAPCETAIGWQFRMSLFSVRPKIGELG